MVIIEAEAKDKLIDEMRENARLRAQLATAKKALGKIVYQEGLSVSGGRIAHEALVELEADE